MTRSNLITLKIIYTLHGPYLVMTKWRLIYSYYLPENNAAFIDAAGANCCRIDELTVAHCDTTQLLLSSLNKDYIRDIVSVEVNQVPIRAVKRGLDRTEITEADKTPRSATQDDCLEVHNLKLRELAKHLLYYRVG